MGTSFDTFDTCFILFLPRQGFNQFYTGYGYTANGYGEPAAAEYFVNNALFSKIQYAAVPLNCSLSSNPIEQQAVSVSGAERSGFVPTLVGYPEDNY